VILGLGVDVVSITRFRELLADSASLFAHATFTHAERAYAQQAVSGDAAQHLAVRFAAKEAYIKALGHAGLPRQSGATWSMQDIEVVRDSQGRPGIMVQGSMADFTQEVGVDKIWLSLSHDGDTAMATVILERF